MRLRANALVVAPEAGGAAPISIDVAIAADSYRAVPVQADRAAGTHAAGAEEAAAERRRAGFRRAGRRHLVERPYLVLRHSVEFLARAAQSGLPPSFRGINPVFSFILAAAGGYVAGILSVHSGNVGDVAKWEHIAALLLTVLGGRAFGSDPAARRAAAGASCAG